MNQFGERVGKIQKLMRDRGISLYLVFTEDYHGSEYVGDYFKEREYLTGFTGSAGSVVVTEDQCLLWTDGRYFLQAAQELEGSGILLMRQGEKDVPKLSEWVGSYCKEFYKKNSRSARVGYDGRTLSVDLMNRLMEAADTSVIWDEKADLVAEIWENRPDFPNGKVWELSSKLAGESREEKLRRIRQVMKEKGTVSHLIASLDDIAWTLNLRGEDILYNPVFLSYLLITEKEVFLYASEEAISGEIKAHLKEDGVQVLPYLSVYEDILKLQGPILLSKEKVNARINGLLQDGGIAIVYEENPSTIFKATKNQVEQENLRRAHIKDGVALTKFLYYLKNELPEGFSELDAAKVLVDLRKQQEGFLEESFAPICAYGEHGAIIHYEATEESNVNLGEGFLLLDTGGQYLEGTTDVTRTVSIGRISDKMKKCYTAVLKGNLRLGAAVFLEGTCGRNLDILARGALWEMGLDYRHGTGHGVGYLLNVHEGPQAIRFRKGGAGEVELAEGMVTSNEPGVYLEGEFGIRLENMILCKRVQETEYGTFLAFDTLTLVPFDRESILPEQLEERERKLLNAYHKRVYEELCPYLEEKERVWLALETAEI